MKICISVIAAEMEENQIKRESRMKTEKWTNAHKYDDIINLPHHQSATHPHMSMMDRAAQFSPFAALTGHEDAIKETARLVEERMELDEDTLRKLDEQLQLIRTNIEEHPTVVITYFLPDERKEGGAYVTVSGAVKKIDEYEQVIILQDGTRIPVVDIAGIAGIR